MAGHPDRASGTGIPSGSSLFSHGVASGDITDTGVVLWTRVHAADDDRVEVTWSIDSADGPANSGTVVAAPENDHTCRVLVDGLTPATDHRYVFGARGETVSGTTRTLPRTADRLRFAVACCSRWGWPGFDRYAAILDEQPDFLLHLGDYIYEIGEPTPAGGLTEPPHDCVTLDDYRRRYRQHRSHAALRELHARLPVIAVWDDHEVVDNAPDEESVRRRAAGQRAWSEWMPTRIDPERPVLDRCLTVEGLIDLVLVDARFRGRRPSDTDGPRRAPDGAGSDDLLAETQWRLLERTARASMAPWFVVAQQVHVSPLTLAYAPARRWPPWRRLVNPDQWDGYPGSRRRLASVLDRIPGRPVVLSGDLHAGWSRVFLEDGRPIAHEFTAPSMSGTTFGEAVREQSHLPRWAVTRILHRLNPMIDHVDLRRHGFLVCDVSPDEFTVTFVHHDGSRVVRRLAVGVDVEPGGTG